MDNDSLLPRVVSPDGSVPAGYAAPLVANGIIGCNVAYTGDLRSVNCHADSTTIWRTGRRFGHSAAYELVPFGGYRLRLFVNDVELLKPDSWEQEIDICSLGVRSLCCYGDVISETVVFAPQGLDALVICNTLTAPVKGARAAIEYNLPALDTPERHVEVVSVPDGFDFAVSGYRFIRGRLRIVRHTEVHDQRTLKNSWLIAFADDYAGAECQFKALERACASFGRMGADGLLAKNVSVMSSALAASRREFPDPLYSLAWNTAIYNLISQSTQWSQPVGIGNSHWAGRYFAWDEAFIHQGLLAAGLTDLAEKIVNFRYAILDKAKMRVAHYGDKETFGARFPWETLEDGENGAPPGFWDDHIFHCAMVALCAWTQYQVTDDMEFLVEKSFPLILNAARFFRTHAMQIDSSGVRFIGKCTDWERLGPACERGFTTTCGAIYTFERACDAIDILGIRSGYAAEYIAFRESADALRRSLPERNGRYVAAFDIDAESLGSTAGLFPFPIFNASDAKQVAALNHFVSAGRHFGNMYPVGEQTCVWFACWLVCAFIRIGDRDRAKVILDEALTTLGVFGECWEINEPRHQSRPWFATASGCLLVALAEFAIQANKPHKCV